MFQFNDDDTLIFEYSKGARGEDGKFISVFADPAVIQRSLEICLPDRNNLIDRYLSAEHLQASKAQQIAAYEKDPVAYMTALVTRDHLYQALLPATVADPSTTPDPNSFPAPVPNPESPLEFARRNNVLPPTEYTPEEIALIKMGGIAHQDLCIGVRKAFQLLEFDETTGNGCTDYMAVAVKNLYHDWLKKKRGNTPDTPIS